MKHDPAFARLVVAVMTAAFTPNGTYWITRHGVRTQLHDAMRAFSDRPGDWLPAQVTMWQAAQAFLDDPAQAIAPAIVQAAIAAPWPAAKAPAPTWQQRRDIGDGADDAGKVAA